MAAGLIESRGGQDDRTDMATSLMAVTWTLTMLALVFVLVRLYIRQVLLRNLGFDDVFIAISMLLGIAFVVTNQVAIAFGYGKHTKQLDLKDAQNAVLWNMISFFFGIAAFAVPKLAVAALLHRVLNPSRIQRIIIWGLTSLVAAVAIVNILIYITTCDPPQGLWKFTMIAKGEAKCRSPWVLVDFATFNGALSAFVDLYLAIYPGYVLFHLQMSLRRKIVLTAVLGLGAAASATAMVKCAQLEGLADREDPTYGSIPLVIWTCVEANVVIMAACMPTLQPVLDPILRVFRLIPTKKNSSSRRPYYQQSDGYFKEPSYAAYAHSKSNSRSRKDADVSLDEASQDTMLQSREADDPFQIHRTDEVLVEYELESQNQHAVPQRTSSFA